MQWHFTHETSWNCTHWHAHLCPLMTFQKPASTCAAGWLGSCLQSSVAAFLSTRSLVSDSSKFGCWLRSVLILRALPRSGLAPVDLETHACRALLETPSSRPKPCKFPCLHFGHLGPQLPQNGPKSLKMLQLVTQKAVCCKGAFTTAFQPPLYAVMVEDVTGIAGQGGARPRIQPQLEDGYWGENMEVTTSIYIMSCHSQSL